jgi:3-deoxy-D-arabino-heptulosonate 7-phosphate (DAHP) synthase
VEIAPDPEAALCDGPQQLAAVDFAAYAQDISAHAALTGKRLA